MFRALIFIVGSLLAASACPLSAADELATTLTKRGELMLEEGFDGDTLVKGWLIQYGEWKPQGGVLRARELATDQHAAAARRLLAMQDGVYQLRFRFTGSAPKGFHFGFDPAPGQLKKRGHLFSVMVSPTGAKLMKHVDKDQPKEDPNVLLAESETAIASEVWHHLLVEKKGDQVSARIQSEKGWAEIQLSASHPTFHVKTPTLVFRCLGDGVEVDDIRVWNVAAE
ncbi:MAG: hypothetical protein KDL87_00700 [Verrucomicrobiae bacterium]|nr:hypothetical protein [Verrucomicrobiae bacterium]